MGKDREVSVNTVEQLCYQCILAIFINYLLLLQINMIEECAYRRWAETAIQFGSVFGVIKVCWCQQGSIGMVCRCILRERREMAQALKIVYFPLISHFYVLKSIIYLFSQKNLMDKRLCLQDHYAQWLAMHHIGEGEKVLMNFKAIGDNFLRPQFKLDNKGIYLINHAQFLMQALVRMQKQIKVGFHLIILMLNYILKINPSIRIPVKTTTIHAINSYLRNSKHGLKSPHLPSSILWLICRTLHATNNKRNLLACLDKCQLITYILLQADLDQLGQKAIAMLLYFIAKNKADTTQLAITILTNSHKFHQADAIKHILAILKDVPLFFYQNNRDANTLLANFLVRIMQHSSFNIHNHLEHLQLILLAATQHPHLIASLKICQSIQNKLGTQTIKHQPLIQQLTKVIQLHRQEGVIKIYLDLAVQTLSNNVVSRRVFILFHQQLTQEQLIRILSNDVLSSLTREIVSHHQIQNALKLMICLKRSVMRLGLNSILWYACKSLIKTILDCELSLLRSQEKDLLELFEQTLKDQIKLIQQI